MDVIGDLAHSVHYRQQMSLDHKRERFIRQYYQDMTGKLVEAVERLLEIGPKGSLHTDVIPSSSAFRNWHLFNDARVLVKYVKEVEDERESRSAD